MLQPSGSHQHGQPSWKKPLALACFLFALAGFAYWLQFKHKPQVEDAEEKSKKLFALDKAQVRSVRIVTLSAPAGSSREFVIECADLASKLCRPGDNSKWQLIAPLKIKADDANVNSLVSTVNNLAASDTIPLQDETPEKKTALLKEYGLDDASLSKDRRIEIATAAGTTVVYLGQTHPIGEGIFSAVERVSADQKPSGKIDTQTVYVLPSYFKSNFDRDLTFWRDKKILPVSTHEIEAFTLNDPKGEVRGTRTGGTWTLQSKKDIVQGDTEALDTLLTGATYLQAKDFADPKALKGTRPVVTLALRKEKDPKPIVLTLHQKPKGKPAKNGVVQYLVYATVSGLDPVFEVEGFAKERLDKDLQDLRLAKLITSMDRFSAKRLSFSGAGFGPAPWVLVNKDSKWSLEQKGDLKGDSKTASKTENEAIDSEKVQEFLDRLTSSKIQQFIAPSSGKKLPVESGGIQIAIGGDTSAPEKKFALWLANDAAGQKLYAKELSSGRQEVFLMDKGLAAAIPWEKERLKKK